MVMLARENAHQSTHPPAHPPILFRDAALGRARMGCNVIRPPCWPWQDAALPIDAGARTINNSFSCADI